MKVHDIRTLRRGRAVLVVALCARRAERRARVYRQTIGRVGAAPGTLQNYGWKGKELVAIRLHMPSRIIDHNARDIDTNEGSACSAATSWRGNSC